MVRLANRYSSGIDNATREQIKLMDQSLQRSSRSVIASGRNVFDASATAKSVREATSSLQWLPRRELRA